MLSRTSDPERQYSHIPTCSFGDEICFGCTPWSNLSAAVDTVRKDLPRGQAILFYNEGFPAIRGNFPQDLFHKTHFPNATRKAHICGDPHTGANISYPHVPLGLDWISVDYVSNFRPRLPFCRKGFSLPYRVLPTNLTLR